MSKRTMVTAGLMAVGVITSVNYAAIAQPSQSPQPNQPATQPNRTATLSALDRQFILDAAQGGMAEVSLAQLATQRATSAALKQYAQRMITDHTRANQELSRLATQKGVTPPPDMGPKYTAVRARLSQLSGANFDRAYISEAGINGHLESEAVFLRQIQLGQDPNLKAFAAKTLPIVQMHLKMARELAGNAAKQNHH